MFSKKNWTESVVGHRGKLLLFYTDVFSLVSSLFSSFFARPSS